MRSTSPRRAPSLLPVVLAAAALLLLAPGADGQTTAPPDRAPRPGMAGEAGNGRIGGFWGLPWGADSTTVVEALGPPLSVSRIGEGLRSFAYTPLFLGRDGYLFLRLAEGEGLVGGSWEPMISDCTGMLRRIVRTMKRRYPDVDHRTAGNVGGGLRRDLCVAAMEDSVWLEVRWEDAAGNRLRVGSSPGRPALRLLGSVAGRRDSLED